MTMPALEFRSITKLFGTHAALKNVSFSVQPGEVLALLGENGAGKSTLMKILSGVWPNGTYEGEFLIQGQVQHLDGAREAQKAGVAMIHQELAVFPQLTVAEHLELESLPFWVNWKELFSRSQNFLDQIGFKMRANDRVGDLPIGSRQLVEIARAIHQNSPIIIFDEPTSALTQSEVDLLYQVIDSLRLQGKAILYITHRMDEVFRLADRMVILRDGQYITEFKKNSRSELEPKIISAMVGRAIEDIYPQRNVVGEKEILRVEDLSLIRLRNQKSRLRKVSFTVRQGEIVGLAGLLGSGRTEIFESIFGAYATAGPWGDQKQKTSGRLWLKGKELHIQTPFDAIQAGLAWVTEDRKGNGLVLNQSIQNNMNLVDLIRRHQFWLTPQEEIKKTTHWAKALLLKHQSIQQPVSELSGGNQQKIVLAKWMMLQPQVLFLDEPTRGIDVGAKAEIYEWIHKLASQGMAIVLASSEMPELLGLCHRILVLREGQISADLPIETANQETMMKAAAL